MPTPLHVCRMAPLRPARINSPSSTTQLVCSRSALSYPTAYRKAIQARGRGYLVVQSAWRDRTVWEYRVHRSSKNTPAVVPRCTAMPLLLQYIGYCCAVRQYCGPYYRRAIQLIEIQDPGRVSGFKGCCKASTSLHKKSLDLRCCTQLPLHLSVAREAAFLVYKISEATLVPK